MTLCYLANARSIHTVRWARHFKEVGWDVIVLSLSPAKIEGIEVLTLKYPKVLGKPGYIFAVPQIRRACRSFKPDILHAHYASSYGVLGVLASWHPLVISVWGTDVSSASGWFRALVLRQTLCRSDEVCATSPFLADITRPVSGGKRISITPFGIDCDQFTPSHKKHDGIVVGTVRNLEAIYGVDVLIRAFAIASRNNATLRLLIVGDGTLRSQLEGLVSSLGLTASVQFTGHVRHDDIPHQLARMDIFAIPTVGDEAFGVAALEAGACQLPVIASAVGGLKSLITEDTGLLVPPADVSALANAIQILALDSPLRKSMGAAARTRVKAHFDWSDTTKAMAELYASVTTTAR